MRIPNLTGVFILAALSLLLPGLGGCSPDWHRRDADRQVYQILRDRKYDTVGYDPQTVVGKDAVTNSPGNPVNRPGEAPDGPVAQVVPAPGASAVPAKAYEKIPATPLPPMEPPPIEVPPPAAEPYGPLGPFPDGVGTGPAGGAGPPGQLGPAGAAAGAPVLQSQPSGIPLMPRYDTPETRTIPGGREELALGPPPPGPKPIELDLFGSLSYGVRNSRQYRDRMDDLYLAALDVTLERHLFEPRPFARVGARYDGGQRDVDYRSALTATANAGVRQRLPYGGEVVAEGLVSFVNALEGNVADGESAQVALSGSLPLLRGAGLVNLEPLIATERELVYRVREFEAFRRSYSVAVATQYFRLLTSLQSVNNRRQNVDTLRQLRERARQLFGAPVGMRGRQTFLEVQRADQALLEGQDGLLRAQQQYLNALDDFKNLIGMDIRQDLNVQPVALDVTVPDVENRDVVDLATRFRLDLQTARDRIEDARRLIAVAENGLLPDLNLSARAAVGNRPGDAARNLDSRDLTYSAGIDLDLPLDRVAERNAYRRALLQYFASRRGYEELHDQVAADVRAAVRAIRQAQSSVVIQLRSIELAQLRLENASVLLRTGGSTSTRDYVEAQSSLLTAQDRYEQAQADLQVQILQFLDRTGTLRVDPNAGTLGRAMDRAMPLAAEPEARPGGGPPVLERPMAGQPTDPVPGNPPPERQQP